MKLIFIMEKLKQPEKKENDPKAILFSPKKKSKLPLVVIGLQHTGKSTIISKFLTNYKSTAQGIVKIKNSMHTTKINGGNVFLDNRKDEVRRKCTIEVKFNAFETDNCLFEIIDTPGGYYSKMYDGLNLADICLFVISAIRKESNKQALYDYLTAVLINNKKFIIFIINKMDTVNNSETVFNKIKSEVENIISKIGIKIHYYFLPCCGLNQRGNILKREENIDWYKGKILLDLIEFK